MESKKINLMRACSEDRALASQLFFGSRHTHKTPTFHIEIMDAWRASDEFILVEAFRGAAKSTLAEEFLLLEACFGNFNYCVLFGETYDKACQRLASIANLATKNVKLYSVFGEVLSKKAIENKLLFKTGALIEAFGWEQEITGMKHLDSRPDRAYLDDVENIERVRSTEAVDQTIKKLYRELLPAMDPARRKIRITQTPRGADCMVTRLRANNEWVVKSFPIVIGQIDDDRSKPMWESRFPMSWVRKERDSYASMGMLREFMQEMMLEVSDANTKPFSEDMIKSADLSPSASWLPKYIIYDPARTASLASSDRTGKVVVSRMGSTIIIHESGGYFWKPDEIRTDIFASEEKHHPVAIGVEKNALDEFLLQPIRFEMMRRGKAIPIKPLSAPNDRDKKSFIMGLHPFFASGEIILVGGRGNHQQLVSEILNFPGGKDDIINALAYALRMFGGTPVYEDFCDENVLPTPEINQGDKLYAAWNARENEVTCALVMARGRHIAIIADFTGVGPILDAARTVLSEISTQYPGTKIEHYCPADLHEQWQRLPLVPALRESGIIAWRGEHMAVARGSLAEDIRTTIKGRRCLTVSKHSHYVLNALAAGYRNPVTFGGMKSEPEDSLSKLFASGIESLTYVLKTAKNTHNIDNANYSTNPQGQRFMSALSTKN